MKVQSSRVIKGNASSETGDSINFHTVFREKLILLLE